MSRAILLGVLLLLALVVPARGEDAEQSNPLECARAYYRHIEARQWHQAYLLRSPARKSRQSFRAWSGIWAGNRSVNTLLSRLGAEKPDRALAEMLIYAVDNDGRGTTLEGEYVVKVTLVRVDGLWWVEDTQARYLGKRR